MKKRSLLVMVVSALLLRGVAGYGGTWEDLPAWKMGTVPCGPEEIEKLLCAMSDAERGTVEDKLLAVLASPNVTADAGQFACRMLQRFGTEKCVPVLAPMLCDETMSHNARLALERMKESQKAGEALKDALKKASDKLKPGLLGSLGERRDANAVDEIGALTLSSDPAVAVAALAALGKIGGPKSLERLQQAGVPGSLKAVQQDALVACATGLPAADAAPIYRQVYDGAAGDAQRAAALRGMVLTADIKAVSIIVELIKGGPSRMRQAALRCVAADKSDKLTAAVSGALGGMNAAQQSEVLGVLAERGDRAALANVLPLLKSSDGQARAAAFAAVSALGDASHVDAILKLAMTDPGAIEAIVMMTDVHVDEALFRALETAPASEPKLQVLALQALAQRGSPKAMPTLIKLVDHADPEVRQAAWSGITTVAAPADIDAMMKMLVSIRDPQEQARCALAVKDFCLRQTDKQGCFQAASAYYKDAPEGIQLLVMDIAAVAGGPQALAVVKSALSSGNKTLHDSAVKVLAAWTGRESAPDLLDLARNAPEETTRIIALRGYIQIIGQNWNKRGKREDPAANREKVAMYKTAAELAKRVDEKRLVLSGLGAVKEAGALQLAGVYLDDAEVRAEAELAVVSLVGALGAPYSAEVPALMEKIISSSQNQDVVNKAKATLQASRPAAAK